MKKLLSFALSVVMLFSIMALSACSKTKNVANITKPGTYELTLENASQYIQVSGNGFGEDLTYISKFNDFGYPEIGFSLDIFCMYKYPSEFSNVTVTYEVIYLYETRLSFDTTQTIVSEPMTITVELNPSGTTTYTHTESVEDAVKHNTYCKYGFKPKVASTILKEISGSITFLPR